MWLVILCLTGMLARSGEAIFGGRKAEVFRSRVIQGLEKRIARFVEFANSFVKSALGARYGAMIDSRPVVS